MDQLNRWMDRLDEMDPKHLELLKDFRAAFGEVYQLVRDLEARRAIDAGRKLEQTIGNIEAALRTRLA
jgi:hypothetical protein